MDTLIDIVLPGDNNVSEATILEWLKSPGDPVNEHEPLLEVSTDKVTMEVPSPATGVLTEIFSSANTVVYPGSVLGRVDKGARVSDPPPAVQRSETSPDSRRDADEDYNADAIVTRSSAGAPRLSPLVRRMLREHGLSPEDVTGSGRDGRITHRDILAHVEGHDSILENQAEDDHSGTIDLDSDWLEPSEEEDSVSSDQQENEHDSVVPTADIHEVPEDEEHQRTQWGQHEDTGVGAGARGDILNNEVAFENDQTTPVDGEIIEQDEASDVRGVYPDVSTQEDGALYSFLQSKDILANSNSPDDDELIDIADCGPPAENDFEAAGADDVPEDFFVDESDAPDLAAMSESVDSDETVIESAVNRLDEVLTRPEAASHSSQTDTPFEFEAEINQRRPHTPMRRAIARHMVESVQKAPHVTAVFDADLTNVMTHRELHRADAERRGIRLTYTSYFVAAAVRAIAEVPEINSVWHDDALELLSRVNVGVATALETEGLIVPVIRNAHELDLLGIARRLQDLVSSARNSALSQADVSGGTFTITNHGVSGSLIATPIINQPQSAILGIGRLEKRVVVKQFEGRDSIQIAPMVYVTLTIDHRGLDGYQANRFLSAFVRILESWELSQLPHYN